MSQAPWRPPPPSQSGTPPSAGRSRSSGEPGQGWGGTAGPSPPAGGSQLSLLLAPARVADLQAEVASLRGHKERCERAVLSLLREMLQLRACVQLQDAELKRLRQDLRPVAQAPEKEALEVSHRHARPEASSPAPGTPRAQLRPPSVLAGPRGLASPSSLQFPSPQNQNQNHQMQALDKRYPPPGGTGVTGRLGAWGRRRLGRDPRASACPSSLSCSGKSCATAAQFRGLALRDCGGGPAARAPGPGP